MTITVAPDPAMTQASAVAELQRIAKAAAKPALAPYCFAVFETALSHFDGSPYVSIYDAETYDTLDKALDIAADVYANENGNNGKLLNITRICTESGSGAVIYNRAQLIAVIEARNEQAALDAEEDRIYGTVEEQARSYYWATR